MLGDFLPIDAQREDKNNFLDVIFKLVQQLGELVLLVTCLL